MTSAVQAGLFYGNNAGIPAFRWYNKDTGKMFVSNHPADARVPGPAPGHRGRPVRGGLLADGVSISNLLTGGREERDDHGRDGHGRGQAPDQHARLLHLPGQPLQLVEGPDGLHRRRLRRVLAGLASGAQEGRAPMHRGVFPYLRAATTVLLRGTPCG